MISVITEIQLPFCMSFSVCAAVLLVYMSGIAEAEENPVVLKGTAELVAAAALEMSQLIIIHTHVVDSDFRGLAGDVCNHKPVWRVNSALSNRSCHIVCIPS